MVGTDVCPNCGRPVELSNLLCRVCLGNFSFPGGGGDDDQGPSPGVNPSNDDGMMEPETTISPPTPSMTSPEPNGTVAPEPV